MTRIAPLAVEHVDADTAGKLKAVKQKLGMLPNLVATLAHAPAALDGYLGLSGAVAGGRLSARQREQIAIAVAEENDCEYCLGAHAALGRRVGLDAPAIEQARDGRAEDPAEAAAIALALDVVRRRGDADLDAARRAGLDDGLVVEVVANVALNVMTNYLNRLAATPADFPLLRPRAAA